VSEELSNYYLSLGEDDAPMDRSHGAHPATPADYGHDELFSFSNVTDMEVFDAIRGIKSETMGLDGISIRFLRLILSSILPCVAHTFNTVLTCSIFPEAWKMSKILPVSKIPNPGELRDYRPFSVLPALSKALEVVIRDQMIRFIDGNRLLSPYQSGFRSGHSTATALLKITNDIQRDCNRRLVTLLLLLDFSKAFENVRHSLLLKKLSLYFKFGGTAAALVGCYLSDRYQCVSVGGILSELITVTKGVLQGSLLGPLFFSILLPRSTSVDFIFTPTMCSSI
jgi:hypothetical protein